MRTTFHRITLLMVLILLIGAALGVSHAYAQEDGTPTVEQLTQTAPHGDDSLADDQSQTIPVDVAVNILNSTMGFITIIAGVSVAGVGVVAVVAFRVRANDSTVRSLENLVTIGLNALKDSLPLNAIGRGIMETGALLTQVSDKDPDGRVPVIVHVNLPEGASLDTVTADFQRYADSYNAA